MKDCRDQTGQGHHKKTHKINKPGLIIVHWDWANNQGACMGQNYTLCIYAYSLVFCGLLTGGLVAVSVAFACFGDPFCPTRMLDPAVIWSSYSMSLISTWYAMFGCPEGKRRRSGWRWGEGTERRGERRNCGQDIMRESINFLKKYKHKRRTVFSQRREVSGADQK